MIDIRESAKSFVLKRLYSHQYWLAWKFISFFKLQVVHYKRSGTRSSVLIDSQQYKIFLKGKVLAYYDEKYVFPGHQEF